MPSAPLQKDIHKHLQAQTVGLNAKLDAWINLLGSLGYAVAYWDAGSHLVGYHLNSSAQNYLGVSVANLDASKLEVSCTKAVICNEQLCVWPPAQKACHKDRDTLLSRREKEVLEWQLVGKSASETAIILGISHRTVEKHRQNLHHKLRALESTR